MKARISNDRDKYVRRSAVGRSPEAEVVEISPEQVDRTSFIVDDNGYFIWGDSTVRPGKPVRRFEG